MTKASMGTLIRDAADRGHSIGAFNVVTLESAEAIVRAAEGLHFPVIIQVSQSNLDHTTSIELCRRANTVGFGSIMFDGSTLPFDENVARTSEVVRWAHGVDLCVEGELGHVAGKAADTAEATLTDPDMAVEFVAATRVDALAVAVGTAHHMTTTTAVLDIERIRMLRSVVPVPLVLHGSSGLDDEQLRAGVAVGIAKVNIATQVNGAFTRAVRETLASDPQIHDLRRYLGRGREAMSVAVARKIAVLAGLGDGDSDRSGHG
jgi:fructose-bisphosphate aldolase class II